MEDGRWMTKRLETVPEAFGVRGHVRALKLRDMSRRRKAATCRRTPKRFARLIKKVRKQSQRLWLVADSYLDAHINCPV